MGKPTICIGENKGADQLRGNREADQAFVIATRIVQFLFYLNPKFQASSSFLCLYRSVCVGPVQKPHCWFSHEVAHYYIVWISTSMITHQSVDFLSLMDPDMVLNSINIILWNVRVYLSFSFCWLICGFTSNQQ